MKVPRFPRLFFTLRLPTLLAMFWGAHVARQKVAGAPRKARMSFIVFRLDALGDVVLTRPLFRALKSAYPGSHCTVVVQKAYKSLLATNPHIDEILAVPAIRPACLPQRLQRLLGAVALYWSELRHRHFDYAISPRWDVDEHFATLLCIMTNAGARVGYSERTTTAKQKMNRGFDRAFDICLPSGPVRHEVLRNLAVGEALGAKSCDGRLEIHVTDSDRKRAGRLLTQVSPKDGRTLRQAQGRPWGTVQSAEFVALGIGAQSPGRRWPLKGYAEVIRQLDRMRRVWPVIVCSASELGDALKLAAMLPREPVIVSGAGLREVCAMLERCELFIGNDSGCAHLAAAMDCPTLVISRHPRNGDPNHFNSPVRFAPHGRQVRVLQPAAGVDTCVKACGSPDPHCILAVSVDEVVAAALQMLTASLPAAVDPWPPKQRNFIAPALLNSHSVDALQAASEALHATSTRPLA